MNVVVLELILICIASFAAGRLQVSGKATKQKAGEELMVLVAIIFVALYIPLNGKEWVWTGAFPLILFFAGFAGKNVLKSLLRRKAKPKVARVVGGPWKQAVRTHHREDDHSDVGIGS